MKTILPPFVDLFGIPVASLTTGEFTQTVLNWAAAPPGHGCVVGYLNAHTVNLLNRSPEYRRLVESMALVYADGMSVVRHSRRVAPPGLPERVNAGDFLARFLWAARSRGLRVALVGSQPGIVQQATRRLEQLVGETPIVHFHHGHFETNSADEEELFGAIRHASPHVILAGMGSPRQEQWAFRAVRETGAPVVWCVGALFEYFADRRRAPVWMRRAGLEWAFRLALEPRRLSKRYLLGNAEFLWHARQDAARPRTETRCARPGRPTYDSHD